MKLGNWEIYIGFLYYRLPEDWENLDEGLKNARPSWNIIGVHLCHETTDERYMLEIRFHRKKMNLRVRPEYTHLPAYWFARTAQTVDL